MRDSHKNKFSSSLRSKNIDMNKKNPQTQWKHKAGQISLDFMSWKTDNIISPRTVRNDSWIWQISTILDVPSDLAKVYKRVLKFSSESGPFCPILDAAVLFRTFSSDFGSPDLISGTCDPNLDTSDFESFYISLILNGLLSPYFDCN